MLRLSPHKPYGLYSAGFHPKDMSKTNDETGKTGVVEPKINTGINEDTVFYLVLGRYQIKRIIKKLNAERTQPKRESHDTTILKVKWVKGFTANNGEEQLQIDNVTIGER